MTSSKRLADEAVEVYPEGLTFFPPLLCASLQSCSADEDYSSLPSFEGVNFIHVKFLSLRVELLRSIVCVDIVVMGPITYYGHLNTTTAMHWCCCIEMPIGNYIRRNGNRFLNQNLNHSLFKS